MTIFYLDPVGGSDAADGLTIGTAWLSTQFAADTVVAGDEVLMLNTGPELITATIDFDTNLGTRTDPIKFTACDSGGTPLTVGYYTIRANAAISNIVSPTTLGNFVVFQNVELDGNSISTSHGFNASGSNEGIGWTFLRCSIHHCGNRGMNIRASTSPQIIVAGCHIHNNVGDGIGPADGSSSRWGRFLVVGTLLNNNGGSGIGGFNAQTVILDRVISHNNTGDGFGNVAATTGSAPMQVSNSIAFANGGDGFNFSLTDNNITAYNNISRSNGGFGISLNAANLANLGWIDYNCYHNNTSGDSDQTLPGDFDVLANPLFTNEGAGTENFLLAPGSPCHLAGVHGGAMGIGSANDNTGGGGGGAVGGLFNGVLQ